MPAGGRGYTRPPSLVSLWSTAPFLLNNIGRPVRSEPSIAARMNVFQASIEQMLWPEKRQSIRCWVTRGVGLMDRTPSGAG